MQFDTTHEYYLNDASLYYCKDHKSLIVHTNHGSVDNRILLSGLTLEAMVSLAKRVIEDTTEAKPKKTTSKTVTT